jgi:hypothetical protein
MAAGRGALPQRQCRCPRDEQGDLFIFCSFYSESLLTSLLGLGRHGGGSLAHTESEKPAGGPGPRARAASLPGVRVTVSDGH